MLVGGSPPGDTVKLREPPKDLATKPSGKPGGGQGNDLGYGNNARDESLVLRDEMDNPQPSPASDLV